MPTKVDLKAARRAQKHARLQAQRKGLTAAKVETQNVRVERDKGSVTTPDGQRAAKSPEPAAVG